MDNIWQNLFIGLVFIIAGIYFLLSSMKDIIDWFRDGDRDVPIHVSMARMGYIRSIIGGILLIVIGIYLTVKYCSI